MIEWFTIIHDQYGTILYRSPAFSKKWMSAKWASRLIDKHHKLNEWFYEVYNESMKDNHRYKNTMEANENYDE
jgi:hypothetical protein